MRVRAIRSHFHAGEYRKEGEVFEYTDKKLHEHVKPVPKAADEAAEEPADPGTQVDSQAK